MLRTSFVYFLAAAALAQTHGYVSSGPAIAVRGYEINSGTGELTSGVRIRYKSVATPDGTSLNLIATGISMGADRVHRFVIDKTTESYFGYDLIIGPANANNRYQAVFQPLTEAEKMVADISGNSSLKPMLLPKYPPPQFVRDGDIIALDLMVSPDGKRKITDYIEVQAPPGSPVADAAAEPLDFTLDDGPVTFDGLPLPNSFWINGQVRELTAFTVKPGATFWIAIPGQGRYILSLAAHDGFLKTGTMRGDTISFADGGQRYAVRFRSPIAGSGKTWNLYVLHDVSYEPKAELRGIISGGTDRLDNLWTKR